MSKSYKKYTCFTDNQNGGAKKEKRFANKKVRRTFELDNGNAYKKLYCSWNIHDFKSVYYNRQEVESARFDWGRAEPYEMYDTVEKAKLFPQWYKFRDH